jgi:putative ABC transport system ATP-binding protein
MTVVLDNVRKSYPTPEGGTSDVIRIKRLDIPKSTQWVITGRSGCGKTTFLNLVAGIVTPDEGTITIDGTDVAKLGEAARDRFRAAHIGFVFQTFNLLPAFTALENVLLGMLFAGRVDRDRAESLLDRVGLADRMHYRPTQLSVGQQQRVSIARALANAPWLILADEPTGNLDPATGATIIDLLKQVCGEGGETLLIVTHQPQVVQSFKDVVDLSKLQNGNP